MTPWYVVRCNIKSEQKAADNLRAAGFEVYLPIMRKDVTHHRTKKRITREFVLFNRYLFIAGPLTRGDWRSCEGVESLLGLERADGAPMPVSAAIVERFRAAQYDMQFDETREAQIHRGEVLRSESENLKRQFPRGATVDVLRGPFGGFSATVENVTGKRKIKAMVKLFGGLSPVEFDAADLQDVDKAA